MLGRVVMGAVLALLLSGCATMFNPGPTMFSATSTPSGATVVVTALQSNETFTQVTPADFTLQLSSDYKLTFELDGFRSEEIIVRRTINGWFIGSILLGVLPGVVDLVTGSMWNHTMTVANVDFVRGASLPDGEALALATVGITDADGKTEWATIRLTLNRL